MKLTLLCFLGFCALAYSVGTQEKFNYKFDKVKLQHQKDVLGLFYHINQPSYFKEHVEIAEKFHFDEHAQDYTKPEVYETFYKYYKYEEFLPKGEVFSVFYEQHLEQAVALFKLFYYAKDFQTFYQTAVWARQYFNEGLFLYAYSVAIVHRPDCYGIVLPPIYEIYPHYFYNSEVIHKAMYYKQVHHGSNEVQDQEHKYWTVYANYSGHYLNLHPEQSLSYFTEDVGLNAFYYYYNLYYPFWMNGKEFHLAEDNRGEQYYYFHQQLLARYYLERLSNGFGGIEWFNWDVPFETSYYPSLEYPQGLAFPSRPQFADLHEYFYNYGQNWCFKSKYGYSYTYINTIEDRIRSAIDLGYVYTHTGEKVNIYTKEGFNILGNLIEGNPDSPHAKYYGAFHVFARHLLGYSHQPLTHYKLHPSALEHFETSLRDPAFYQFYKKIVLFFQKYKANIPSYTEEELYYHGVEVNKVEFDRLVTYFDFFESDITNAVYVTPDEYKNHNNFHVVAKQQRLNHKPFTYKVHVKSDKTAKVAVKVFLGPKYDEYGRYVNITENRVNFVAFDHFVYDLKTGDNVIQRYSTDSPFYGPDRTSYRELYKQILTNEAQDFTYSWKTNYWYFPQRFMLPKGTTNGMEYQFFVMVYPYTPYKHNEHHVEEQYYQPKIGTASQHIDGFALGYPFDRFIQYPNMFYNMPNGYFYETTIYHKQAEDIVGHY